MNKIIILLMGLCLLAQTDGYSSCRKKKRKKKAKMTNTQKTDSSISKSSTLVVSFISFAGGIDFKAVPGFEKSLKDFNLTQNCQLKYEMKAWGREGERDYCITASDEKCLLRFTEQAKVDYKGNDRILIKENAKCR